ncbi:MAG: CrcB family protein [Bilophila sp.]
MTTFSTFAMDTFAALRDSHPGKALLNVGLNMALGLGAAALGFSL